MTTTPTQRAGLWGRIVEVSLSLWSAPAWVRVWVFVFLVPVNFWAVGAWLATDHPLPAWLSLAWLFVVVVNSAITLIERGVSKVTSASHLIVWLPAWVYAVWWLMQGTLDGHVLKLAWAYVIIIGICNIFDLYDTWRWLKGERDVLGKEA
ncbi:MAG: hypothetical protein AAFQ59_09780 [Pseudomonadota bacterium]